MAKNKNLNVKENLKDIDKTIAICLKNYTLDRLSYVDRNLIRIATYELKYNKTPKAVVLNEIVELSHEYSEIKGFDTTHSSFHNNHLFYLFYHILYYF